MTIAPESRLPLFEEPDFLSQLQSMDLQWFGPEEEGRTEDPTEQKIRKAREDGRVAKSQDLSAAVVILGTVLLILALGGYIIDQLLEMINFFLRQSTEWNVVNDLGLLNVFMGYMARIVLPIGLSAMVMAFLGNVFQVGFLFSTKPIKPDLKKIAPDIVKYLKRSLGSTEALFNLAKAMGKVLIIGLLGFLTISGNIDRLRTLSYQQPAEGFGFVLSLMFQLGIQAAVILLVLSLFDYQFQRKQYKDSLKMTKQEIKEERKTYEGDPMVKSRLRQRMREMLSQNMMQQVPKADVVVTNPTHFAVAMEYDPERMMAPTVLAKGQDNMAFRIREVATENAIPIIENKPLARALYAEVDLGEVIPERYFEAMVTVMKEVYRMKEPKRRAG